MRYLIAILLTLTLTNTGICQQGDNATALPSTTTSKFLNSITSKFDKLQNSITSSTDKMLHHLEKQEAKLEKKLRRKDSTAANKLFADTKARYAALHEKLDSTTNNKTLKEYIPQFDTLKTSLAFLDKNLKANNPLTPQLNKAKAELKQFESKLQAANEIKRIIRERKQQLNAQLKEYGLGKELMKMNKEVYYYQQQLNEYKSYLKDPKKIEQKAIALLRETPLFKDFMAKNSMLAQIFKLPENYGTPQSLAGLQTRANIQQLLDQRIAAGGPNAMQQVRQNIQQAQSKLTELKKQVTKLGGNGSDADMPNFKPNTQKTKSFAQRLEYGFTLQTQKVNGLLPNTSDMALTIGYKLNDKSAVGMGVSYKMGWGTGFNNIKLTNQGVGFRSYLDYKIKGNWWVSGGYEQTYFHEFGKLSDIYNNINVWQQSGLIGVTKKLKIGKKKTSNIQLLWDFLSYQQVPRGEALKFRVGYNF